MGALEKADDSAFIRQRRNLILISLGLIASLHYGLTFEKINILGNETKLPGSEPVAGVLWWFWAYLLWRYITAFCDLGDCHIAEAYRNFLWRILIRHSKRWWFSTEHASLEGAEFLNANPKGAGPFLGSYFDVMTLQFRHLVPQKDLKVPEEQKLDWKVPWTIRIASRLEAMFLLTFQTSKVSEYMVPFLIAFAPVAYWMFQAGRRAALFG